MWSFGMKGGVTEKPVLSVALMLTNIMTERDMGMDKSWAVYRIQ
jgi:hypothetical protein